MSRDPVAPPEAPVLAADDDARVLSALGSGTAEALRERAVVSLMRYAGLSGAEVSALDVEHVQLADPAGPQLVAAGRQPRTVPLHPDLASALRAWLRAREDWPGTAGSPALFVNRFGERLGSRSVTGIVQQVGDRAGVALSPAALRATFADALHAQGAEPSVVAALTGRRFTDRGPSPAPTHEALRAAVTALSTSGSGRS